MKKIFFAILTAFTAVNFNCKADNSLEMRVAEPMLVGQETTIEIWAHIETPLTMGMIQAYVAPPQGFTFVSGSTTWNTTDITAMMASSNVTPDERLTIAYLMCTVGAGDVKIATAKVQVSPFAVSGVSENENNKIGTSTFTASYDFDANVKIGAGGYSTYCNPNDVKIEGATVEYGAVEGTTVIETEVTNNVVSGSTGVLLKGTEGEVAKVVPAIQEVASVLPTDANNQLIANLEEKTCASEKELYILSTKNGKTAFYFNAKEVVIPAGKAYLPAGVASGARAIGLGDETDINQINVEETAINYNLMGQQVKTANGIFIENGQKVIKK